MSVPSPPRPRPPRLDLVVTLALAAWSLTPGVSGAADPTAQVAPATEANTVRVASIVYGGQHPERVAPECRENNNCAIEMLIRQAHAQRAQLIVAPEYGLDQSGDEPDPLVGTLSYEMPARAHLARRFAALADELDVYLVINLETREGTDNFNTQLAFDPSGRLVAKHHKFELYGGERDTMTAGHDVSIFDTPFGRVGLLICADIYGDPALHRRLTRELGANIIAFSAEWTVRGAARWQAAFAHDWGVYVVGSNGADGAGQGGGIFDRQGKAIASSKAGDAQVLVATVPVKP